MTPLIRRVAGRYLIKRASGNSQVIHVMEHFWGRFKLPGSPQPKFTSQAIILHVPNWQGRVASLEKAVQDFLSDGVAEALDIEDVRVSEWDIKITGANSGTDGRLTAIGALVTFHLRPYDPEEDQPF